jgi:hypothetical protein
MHTVVSESGGVRIVECGEPVLRVEDALDLIAACFEAGTRRVLLEARMLPASFFDLSTRFAGEFLQKLGNYGILCAAVIPAAPSQSERFGEFVREAKTGRTFRVFDTRSDAEAWLAA